MLLFTFISELQHMHNHQSLSQKKGNAVTDIAPHLKTYRKYFHADAKENTMNRSRGKHDESIETCGKICLAQRIL